MTPLSEQPAVLLVHGLGGTEYDLGSLAKRLAETGFATSVPCLPGHGGTPSDLLEVRLEDWLDTVTSEYRALRSRHRTVHLAGFCLGALIALEVARLTDHRDNLLLLSPPLFLDGWALPSLTWARHFVYPFRRFTDHYRIDEADPFGIKNARIRGLIRKRFARGDRFHYPYVPLTTIRQVDRLRRTLLRGMGAVKAPTMIMHAEEDEITSLRSAQCIAGRIGGPCKLIVLNDSYHMILVDNEREAVMKLSLEFFGAPDDAPPRPEAAPQEASGWRHQALPV
ncbi:alpha/beta hydrolase [Paludibacterium paludis]|uniref:AB hydrolase-1 domain-containing protein n=1 Tax=Paludibacterium paludis TaxID=1225769 RepID=A0A918P3Z0_9NEIS|nr:alpha/beta fold hydrolase [Paludibacterium paludis]GGY16879.1 hypothetical protein GCM10011289_20410 [Paludibacterium paludis]